MPRPLTVILGAGSTGKTTIATAIALTRPGHATVLARRARGEDVAATFAVADYDLSDDDPGRADAVRVASPLAVLDEGEPAALTRRREQAAVDKVAQAGGFAFQALPGVRWFSRSALVLSSPERMFRHDAKATVSFDDATRADVSRETKQVLAYAAIAAALVRDGDGADRRGVLAFERALVSALEALAPVTGFRFVGACPSTFEPLFLPAEEAGPRDAGPMDRTRPLPFDDLPTAARHLISFVALPLRSLAAAYPDRPPGAAEGVVVVDDADLHQAPAVLRALPAALVLALPRVQWILTTGSAELAAGVPESALLTLRRVSTSSIAVFSGAEASTH